MRAHVRQCDPSLPFNWPDDPAEEVRAPVHNLLHNAPALVVILPHFMIAFLQLRPRPRIEVVTLQQLRPVVRSYSPQCSSDHCACQMQAAASSQQSQFATPLSVIAVAASSGKLIANIIMPV